MTAKKSVRRSWPWFAAGGVVLLVAIGILVLPLTGWFDSDSAEPVATPAATAEREPRPTRDIAPAPEPVTAPAPKIDIPETRQMPYTPVWNPPDQGEYFWQIVDPANGYPEDGGTDFILAHACENQQCAGDQFRLLEVGDTLTYKGELYQVEDAREIMKVDIAQQDVWHHDPNRLVIITCIIETTWDQSDKNDLIIATRVAS